MPCSRAEVRRHQVGLGCVAVVADRGPERVGRVAHAADQDQRPDPARAATAAAAASQASGQRAAEEEQHVDVVGHRVLERQPARDRVEQVAHRRRAPHQGQHRAVGQPVLGGHLEAVALVEGDVARVRALQVARAARRRRRGRVRAPAARCPVRDHGARDGRRGSRGTSAARPGAACSICREGGADRLSRVARPIPGAAAHDQRQRLARRSRQASGPSQSAAPPSVCQARAGPHERGGVQVEVRRAVPPPLGRGPGRPTTAPGRPSNAACRSATICSARRSARRHLDPRAVLRHRGDVADLRLVGADGASRRPPGTPRAAPPRPPSSRSRRRCSGARRRRTGSRCWSAGCGRGTARGRTGRGRS